MSVAIVWFRNNLRLHDNESLTKALKNHSIVIPFYCFDEILFSTTKFGYPKIGVHRAQLLIESVQNLRENLRKVGSDLVIRVGNTASYLKHLSLETNATTIYTQKEITFEEVELERRVERVFNGSIEYAYDAFLFHPDDIPFALEDTPFIFTSFRKLLERNTSIRPCIALPSKLNNLSNRIQKGTIPSLNDFKFSNPIKDNRSVLAFKGGEDEANNRLNHYFYESQELLLYKEKRNGLIGADYSSKLSVWLWNGCISPRHIYWEVKRFEHEYYSNDSTYWLIFELIWRDFFKYTALKNGNKIFHSHGINGHQNLVNPNPEFVNAWIRGKTGVPFIDANMRELAATGFMSNRGRQNVASFFVKELQQDWRVGAEYFESMLLDYDVCSNYGNWMYIAGVGNDSRDRFFNVILQAKNYDSQGKYVRLWIPELNNVEKKEVHHPWASPKTLFNHLDVVDYPKLIILPPDYWKKHY
ncbi:DASH family cryptochrome [bacterium]|nr:DASH family cryptochrome [bacterium]